MIDFVTVQVGLIDVMCLYTIGAVQGKRYREMGFEGICKTGISKSIKKIVKKPRNDTNIVRK